MQCVRRRHVCKDSLNSDGSSTLSTNFIPAKTIWTIWTCWLWDAALELSNATSQSLDVRQNSWRLFELLRYKWDEKGVSLQRHYVYARLETFLNPPWTCTLWNFARIHWTLKNHQPFSTSFFPAKTFWTIWTCWLRDAALMLHLKAWIGDRVTEDSLNNIRYNWDEKDKPVLLRLHMFVRPWRLETLLNARGHCTPQNFNVITIKRPECLYRI